MSARIPLTRGQFALVDDEDVALVSGFSWYADTTSPGKVYVTAYVPGSGRKEQKKIRMHRLIMGAKPGQDVDHKDGNGLDNRRHNLRVGTHQQNMSNMKKPVSGKTSRFKGVLFAKNRKVWAASITKDYQNKFLGYFQNEIEAAKAYDRAAVELFGEFARLNFPTKESVCLP